MYVRAMIGFKPYEFHSECFNVTSRENAAKEIQVQLDGFNETLASWQEKRRLYGVIEELDISDNEQFHERAMAFYRMVKRESSMTSSDKWCKENVGEVHYLMLLSSKKQWIEEMQDMIRESPFNDQFVKMLEYEAK
ncbi:MAG: hypothetical protein KAS66_01940 [Candidatus Omnitrophica bacterium]|nr:hypothetical protein [Candidatus Omnitrophota bacterium]